MADEVREVTEIIKFFGEVAENGCPPKANCKDYALSNKAYGIQTAVDCKLCLETETAKLLKSLGYRKIPELTLIGDDRIGEILGDVWYGRYIPLDKQRALIRCLLEAQRKHDRETLQQIKGER